MGAEIESTEGARNQRETAKARLPEGAYGPEIPEGWVFDAINEEYERREAQIELNALEVLEKCSEYLDPEDIEWIKEEIAELNSEQATSFVFDYVAQILLMQGLESEDLFRELGLKDD